MIVANYLALADVLIRSLLIMDKYNLYSKENANVTVSRVDDDGIASC